MIRILNTRSGSLHFIVEISKKEKEEVNLA